MRRKKKGGSKGTLVGRVAVHSEYTLGYIIGTVCAASHVPLGRKDSTNRKYTGVRLTG